MEKILHSTAKVQETAILVALISRRQNEEKTKEYLNELEFLAETAGVKILKSFTQRLERPDTKTFVGKGKLEDIKVFVKDHKVDMLVFDDDLSPSHVRNLEKELECKILDRSLLILQIFMARAKTTQARTQVELAHYQYMLPRLTRMWTHLSRQKGGVGTRGGAGEMELETDKRVIKDKIVLLKEKLKKIELQNATQRRSREQMVRVALVGYTNVGKSTLMNLMAKSEVFAENKLFATVDSTVRKVNFGNIPFLLSDTVGFIRKLPTTLIESFKSTLSEIVEADILLHIIDVSHTSFEEHIQVVSNTLKEIGASNKIHILVFNKIDLYRNPDVVELATRPPTISELRQMYMGKEDQAVFISAEKRENIDELRAVLQKEVVKRHYTIYPNYV